MSDVSSMYIIYLLELQKWGGDTAIMKELWPIAKKAAQWHIDVSAVDGVPNYLCNTTMDLARPSTARCRSTASFIWPR